jgi:hypothetical protein
MRLQNSLFALVIAIPAAGQAFFPVGQAFLSPSQDCFTSGSSAYRISSTSQPDFRVRIDNAAAKPDLRIQLIDQSASADFVLVDDLDAAQGHACPASTALKTIRIDDNEKSPDLTISLSTDATPSDYKLYVHSARFSDQDAAALFGVMWQTSRRRDLAQTR